eukprot:465913-Amphidinium_carterae.1
MVVSGHVYLQRQVDVEAQAAEVSSAAHSTGRHSDVSISSGEEGDHAEAFGPVDHTSLVAWHRCARRQRQQARFLVQGLRARELLEKHHSARHQLLPQVTMGARHLWWACAHARCRVWEWSRVGLCAAERFHGYHNTSYQQDKGLPGVGSYIPVPKGKKAQRTPTAMHAQRRSLGNPKTQGHVKESANGNVKSRT